jgi:pantothenate synthetase
MVSECKLTVQIRSVEICREQSGLAMSSRNNYLSLEQKQIALKLRTTLLKAAMTLEEEGLKEAQAFCKLAKEDKSFNYLEIRNRKTFMPVQ